MRTEEKRRTGEKKGEKWRGDEGVEKMRTGEKGDNKTRGGGEGKTGEKKIENRNEEKGEKRTGEEVRREEDKSSKTCEL